ncbi:MAG: hypothetical protein CEE40_07215 [Chloroflexi bacterium B3_Chlor]|nr:MAG: hypothetical protein CEE40_07215 [Chloroflexi bacterium B3_Chlor]
MRERALGTSRTLTTQFAYNGDGARTSKTVDGTTTDYVVDLAATLPVVISDTDAIYLYGLDIIAEQLAQSDRYYLRARRAGERAAPFDWAQGRACGQHRPDSGDLRLRSLRRAAGG